MAREDVEVVRQALDAYNSGDIARILALTHPDFEAVIPAELSAEPDVYRGHDGIRRYFESFRDAMDEIVFEVERYTDAGTAVLVEMRLTARGRLTSIAVEQRNVGVWTVRDGRVIGVRAYAELADARRALGLDGP